MPFFLIVMYGVIKIVCETLLTVFRHFNIKKELFLRFTGFELGNEIERNFL